MRRMVLSAAVILSIILCACSQNPASTTSSSPPIMTATFVLPQTTSSATTAHLTLQIVSVTSPIAHGAYATLNAQTTPGALCDITVYYKSGPSTAQGLYPKTADASGKVSWTWKVGTNTTPGSWRIVVTATLSGQNISQTVYFTVT